MVRPDLMRWPRVGKLEGRWILDAGTRVNADAARRKADPMEDSMCVLESCRVPFLVPGELLHKVPYLKAVMSGDVPHVRAVSGVVQVNNLKPELLRPILKYVETSQVRYLLTRLSTREDLENLCSAFLFLRIPWPDAISLNELQEHLDSVISCSGREGSTEEKARSRNNARNALVSLTLGLFLDRYDLEVDDVRWDILRKMEFILSNYSAFRSTLLPRMRFHVIQMYTNKIKNYLTEEEYLKIEAPYFQIRTDALNHSVHSTESEPKDGSAIDSHEVYEFAAREVVFTVTSGPLARIPYLELAFVGSFPRKKDANGVLQLDELDPVLLKPILVYAKTLEIRHLFSHLSSQGNAIELFEAMDYLCMSTPDIISLYELQGHLDDVIFHSRYLKRRKRARDAAVSFALALHLGKYDLENLSVCDEIASKLQFIFSRYLTFRRRMRFHINQVYFEKFKSRASLEQQQRIEEWSNSHFVRSGARDSGSVASETEVVSGADESSSDDWSVCDETEGFDGDSFVSYSCDSYDSYDDYHSYCPGYDSDESSEEIYDYGYFGDGF